MGEIQVTKRLPWTLSRTAVLVLAFVAATYVLLVRYDYNAFKPRIAKAMREFTGRELSRSREVRDLSKS